jgi:hypothetical protein
MAPTRLEKKALLAALAGLMDEFDPTFSIVTP